MIQNLVFILSAVFFIVTLLIIYFFVLKPRKAHPELLKKPFPEPYKRILKKRVLFYRNLPAEKKTEFERRILLFMAEKDILGVETQIDDTDRLLVAASAVIPMFGYDYFRYPTVKEVLIYPHSFDKEFQTDDMAQQKNILGMVGDGFMRGSVVLSKPDLEAAFDGTRHIHNVGIHEFTHLIDGADGATDGVPEILIEHSFVMPWLKEIRREMEKIVSHHSDINPYGLTNNAEFLAVVSEYFFDDPEKMKSRHKELYDIMVQIFHQKPDDYV
ncbi:MAG: zinc-dependent peptidase [Bacteroidales bacterium]|nr:zinc-dependent peptidase [Bacteroidales bacterium]